MVGKEGAVAFVTELAQHFPPMGEENDQNVIQESGDFIPVEVKLPLYLIS
jgi:hypothetical protein